MTRCLFMGGPIDGTCLEIRDLPRYYAVPTPDGGIPLRCVEYRLEFLSGDGGATLIPIYVHSLADGIAIMARLIACYRPTKT